MPEITTLFWDNGGVILTNGWDRGSRRLAVGKFGLDWDDFEDRHELLLEAFETGALLLDDYLKRVVFYRPRSFTPDDFKKFMFDQSQPYPESLAFVQSLTRSRKYMMASLNNESLEINEYRIAKFQLREYFEAFFSSCYLRLRKPHAEIYQLALKITQCKAQECVLVDDRNLNLECAHDLGINTIQYKNVAQLRDDLAGFGVTPNSIAAEG